MQKPKALWIGARKSLTRAEAIEQYVILRLRTEDVNRLDFLVNAFYDKRITLPPDSPFSAQDLKDTVRTSFLGWFATLTDRDGRAIYAFDCLFKLFPERKAQIIKAQLSLEAVHEKLQHFRNNVAFHARAKVADQITARMNLRDEDTYLDLVSAIHDSKLDENVESRRIDRNSRTPKSVGAVACESAPSICPAVKIADIPAQRICHNLLHVRTI